jgi:hypothetical protein
VGYQTHQEQTGTHEDALQAVIVMIVAMAMSTAALVMLLVVMVVIAATLMMLLVAMVVTTAALMVVLVVMVVTAAALMMLLVVVMVTAAALVVLIVVIMMAAAALVVLLVVMMMAAAALMMLLMVVMVTAATALVIIMMVLLSLPAGRPGGIPGIDLHAALHSLGDLDQLGNQCIRVSGSEPQLLGCEGDNCLLHFRVGIEFRLDLGGAVGAVQIVDDVYLPGHRDTSSIRYMSNCSCVFFSIIPHPPAVKRHS